MKKNQWISARVKELTNNGASLETAISQAHAAYGNMFQKGGAYNDVDATDLPQINKNVNSVQFTMEGAQALFGKEIPPVNQTTANLSMQNHMVFDPHTQKVVDITSDTNRYTPDGGMMVGDFKKVWNTHPEVFVGKNMPQEGRDFVYMNPAQFRAFQSTPGYQDYKAGSQSGVAQNDLPAYQGGGNVNFPPIGYNPNMQFPQQPTGFPQNNTAQNWAQQNPLPQMGGFDSFHYDPNVVDPNNKPSGYKINENQEQASVEPTTTNTSFDRLNIFNPYGGFDTPTAAYTLGQGIHDKNPLEAAVSGIKLTASLGRNFMAGFGEAKANKYVEDEYNQKMRHINDKPTYMLEGGDFRHFMQQGGEVTDAQALTGDYMTGMPNANVEIEKNEQVMNGDTGTIQKAVGDTHEDGGIPVNLADGSKVLSDFTKIGGENAKEFRKMFDIEVKATDTFSKVMDKVNKKIGLKKKTEEETQLIEQIEKQVKSGGDKTTQDLNMSFLGKKLQELQQEKAPLQQAQKSAFDAIFKEQEKIPKKNTGKEMQEGGQFTPDVLDMARQYNIAPERIQQMIEQSSEPTPQFQDGGSFRIASKYEDPSKFIPQSEIGEGYYGQVLAPDGTNNGLSVTSEIARLHPELYAQYFQKDKILPKDTKAFQSAVNAKYDSILTDAKKLYGEDSEKVKALSAQIEKDKFLADQSVRGVEGKFGNYSSTRPNYALEVIPKDQLKALQDAGINTASQLKEKNPEMYKKYLAGKGLSSDFWLGEIPEQAAVDPVEKTPDKVQDYHENIRTVAPLFPESYNPFPTPLQPVLKGEISLNHLDPNKISAEPNLVELERQRQAATAMNQNLAPGQAVANNYATLVATNQGGNQAISNAEMYNADARTKADTYNLGADAKTDLSNLGYALNYEQRALLGKAKTQKEIDDYFSYNSAINNQHYKDARDLNTLNAGFDNYQITPDGQVMFNNAPVNLQPSGNAGFDKDYFLKLNASARKKYLASLGIKQ